MDSGPWCWQTSNDRESVRLRDELRARGYGDVAANSGTSVPLVVLPENSPNLAAITKYLASREDVLSGPVRQSRI